MYPVLYTFLQSEKGKYNSLETVPIRVEASLIRTNKELDCETDNV
jgi:hypothetical protein